MKIKIFRMNDCDYYIGESLKSCKEHYMKLTGLDKDEAFEEARVLTNKELGQMIFDNREGDIDHYPKGELTFKDALKLEIEKNDVAYPYLFASTEY